MFTSEVSTGTCHAALNLIRDIHNSVVVAPFHKGVQIALRWNNEPAFALDGFDYQARNLTCSDSLFQIGDGALGGLVAAEPIMER